VCLDDTQIVEACTVALNLWFEHQIDAYLTASAQGRDWREAVAEADKAIGSAPRRVLTQKELKARKGIHFSRQRLNKKVKDGSFLPPFHLPNVHDPEAAAHQRASRDARRQQAGQSNTARI
jgi:hypothetical protein